MNEKKKIKKPVKGKIAKVPVVLQMEALECGAACLAMILGYYQKWISLEQVRVDCGVSRDGSSAINIVKAARSYNLNADGYKLEPEELKTEGEFPCIIHWNFNHFVVLKGFKGNKAYLVDPGKGEVAVSMKEFDEAFTGIALMFSPNENFIPSGERKTVLDFAKKRLHGLQIPIAITILTTVITSLLQLISPVFNKVFFDRIMTGVNPDWFIPFLIGLGLLYLAEIVTAIITTSVNLRINGKMSLVGNLSYMWKVLHLPMSFFSQRMVGDIQARRSENATVASTLINTLSPLVLQGAMMIIYLIVMFRYSWVLTIVGLVSVLIDFALSQYITALCINEARVKARNEGKLSSATVSGIQMIETIKSSGAEEGYFRKWAGHFAAVNSVEQKSNKETQIISLVPTLVSNLGNYLIIGFGVYLTLNGQFTIGSITAFQGFFASFLSPATTFINAGQTIQQMAISMERIEDVMQYPEDPYTLDSNDSNEKNREKLSGDIEIKNVTFGYSPLGDPLIKNFSLHVTPGSKIALVGASGCGKSTLSKLISGINKPWSGEILFDGKRIDQIDHRVFTGSLAVVDQDIVLFDDTVANNIKMWDDSIEDFEMILAAKDAEMHYDIVAKDGGYQHKIVEGGKDFSGGQRQRLEIARALAQEPNIIILDEATSALDAQTEYKVVKAIQNRGITCIVIAHRLSTIRDCDRILVLNKGEVVEEGTHEELMKQNGYYSQLVSND